MMIEVGTQTGKNQIFLICKSSKTSSSNLTSLNIYRDIYQLLPTVFYYGYEGSITYPPCSQHVIWRFLDLPGFLSWKQYHRLQKLVLEQVDEKSCKPVKVAYNGGINRPLQTNNYKTWRCRGWSIKHEEDFINAWPANYHGSKRLEIQDN